MQKLIVVRKHKSEWQCICPFHDDHSPSMYINKDKGVWNCFGCGAGGSTRELLKKLELDDSQADVFHYIPPKEFGEGTTGAKFMRDRGYYPDTLEDFEVVCSDRYVSIPIRLRANRELIGMVYRNFIDGLPKYLYSKGLERHTVLFGVDKYAPDDSNEVILVEGSLDVMWFHQAGFRNVVGIMGSSVSKEQVNKLKYLSTKVCLAFDSDEAGQKCTEKSLDLFLRSGFSVTFMEWPEGILDGKRLRPEELEIVWKNRKGWLEKRLCSIVST